MAPVPPLVIASLACLVLLAPHRAWGQQTGTITGTVTRASDAGSIPNALVSVSGTTISAATDRQGWYRLEAVPAGEHTVVARLLGYRTTEATVTVSPGRTHTLDLTLTLQPILLSDVVVEAAARGPQPIVEAPAAVSVVDIRAAHDLAITGQAARALSGVPGVDVVQNGVFDYNVNARGMNSSLSRRVLVLQDGRDLAFGFLGTPGWGLMSNPLDEMGRIEMVRGPGSALYGANAYNGVVSFTTPTAREIVGTKLTLSGGSQSTMKGDLRHAGLASGGRLGYKLSAGNYRSDTWAVARTSADGGDLRREYAPATEDSIPDMIEGVPLIGQTLDPQTRAAVGDADPVEGVYGSGRFDYYLAHGSVATLDGGVAWLGKDVYVTGAGRVQLDNIVRPWGRLSWTGNRFSLMTWINATSFTKPVIGLPAGHLLENDSRTLHAEGQYNTLLFGGRGRVVLGASARSAYVNTKGSLLAPEFDDRTDDYYSAFGQVEAEVVPRVTIVGAARIDDGSLYETQISPKGAIVFSPSELHAVRFTVNRAFMAASQAELFASIPVAPPADFSLLELGLRASPLGPALAGVPPGELFTTSSAVPILAIGNENLDVEEVTSLELGYKGGIAERWFWTIDANYSRYTNFVTDALPGVNPIYSGWTAPEQVPEPARAPLEQAVTDQLLAAGQPLAALGLTRLKNGNTAIVLSYTNAGRVDQYGLEVGLGVAVTPEIRLDGNLALYEFEVDSAALRTGDQLKPNSPSRIANVSASYRGTQGFDARVSAQLVNSFDWAAGIFVGRVPARQYIDVSAGYRINDVLRIHAVATNVFDQKRYLLYGGAVIGRRVLGGITATF